MHYFKTIFENALKQHGNSKRAEQFFKQEMIRAHNTKENNDMYYATMMYSWHEQEPKDRKILRITSEGRDLTELFRKLNDIDLINYIKEYENKHGKLEDKLPGSFVIEFEKPIDLNFLMKEEVINISDERAKDQLYVTELMVILEAGLLVAPVPNTDQTFMLLLASDYFTKLYLYFKLDKFSIITTEKESMVKYEISKNIPKPSTMKWRYQDLTVTRKAYDKPKTSRPFSYEGKEEVVKVRKSHYRRLRNGEVRFFVGIEAKYYVKKDLEIHGNIIKM